MANDLCKKHSFGYEPLKVIGLSVAGKDCLLCLAEENTKLQAENKLLKKSLKRYGHHDSPCSALIDKHEGSECICGFDQAFQEKPE